ncbi:unnamed protein product [Rotaria magnacalcarata]|uniref:Uncharacterized protein n=1 Tax=Rotaria magnacalcarata TaxID=392030 RepID=A0A8S2L434_9BILA|nr:unnamed protein product [Rotaria magnacalcarata]CAF3885423.1 unnamed protein product [Rotaria magnacalcarata]CAF4851712.1 unnamed protein product [Rotaria magnacalcarata]
MRIISECSLSQDIRGISDDIQMSEIVLQKNVRLGPTELHLLAIVELQAIHVYDKPHLNQPIDYLDPRSEYTRVINEWSTKSSISTVRIVSPNN